MRIDPSFCFEYKMNYIVQLLDLLFILTVISITYCMIFCCFLLGENPLNVRALVHANSTKEPNKMYT